ncbi:MAG: type II toxin-antitoxin system Phd/YefM family antitoxin [Pseudonocardiales bacterium]
MAPARTLQHVPTLPFTEARARFIEIIGRAEYAKTPTVIIKRGREVAVVMPIEALTYLLAAKSPCRPRSGFVTGSRTSR